MARKCIFCGGGPVTREHAWPRWLLRKVGSVPESQIRAVVNGELIRSWNSADAVRVRVVCSGCNEGWMSKLEADVGPLITLMLSGSSVSLDAQQQQAVAAWITKTAMVFEYPLRESYREEIGADSFFGGHERGCLMEQQLPDSLRGVWLAEGPDNTFDIETAGRFLVTKQSQGPAAYVFTAFATNGKSQRVFSRCDESLLGGYPESATILEFEIFALLGHASGKPD